MAIEKNEAVRLVIEAGHRLCEAGLIARTWGNISARISDTQFVITPSGKAYDTLTPDDIVTVNIADCSYEGDVKPSSEKGIHAESYKYRPDINFVIHTHQLYATAFGTLGEALVTGDESLGNIVPCAEYGISSTKKLKNRVSEAIQANLGSNAFFMRCHGALCLGTDIENAFSVSLRLEEICKAEVLKRVILDTPEDCGFVLPQELSEELNGLSVLLVNTPAVYAVSKKRGTVRPMIDDMAQIGGTDFACVRVKAGWEKKAAKHLANRNVVFLNELGAVCTGSSLDEAEAVASVLEKNCLAKLYSEACGKRHHLEYFDALLQRTVYLMKYSKLK